VIDRAARAAGDAEKLSVHMRTMSDLLYEADYWAPERARSTVTSDDVDRAVEAQQQRAGRIKARLMQAFERGDVLIASTGSSIGQVNGLSVFQLGEHVFGVPTRISARVRVGRGEVIEIEREVELGDPSIPRECSSWPASWAHVTRRACRWRPRRRWCSSSLTPRWREIARRSQSSAPCSRRWATCP
jgi:predicted ATP-dependent protease